MEWTLDQMPLGQEAVVLQIEENSMLGRRMREMGITEGVRICRKRQAPLGDPSVYMVRGSAYKPPQRALNLFLPICLTAEPKNGGKGRAKYAKSNDRAGGKSQLR